MGKLFPVDDLTRRRATEADITRESPFGDLRLVRPNNLAATLVLFGWTELAGVFGIDE